MKQIRSSLTFVSARNPKRMAVNFSADNSVADGISHTDYLLLTEALGDKYASRIVSAEGVIADFLAEIDGNVFVRDPDGNENNNNDYVLQPGDIVTILNCSGEGYFEADLGGNGYLLREGETDLPRHVQGIWDDAMKVREILRTNIKAGPTAGETLESLIKNLQEAGFVYIDEDRFDPSLDLTKTQVHLDLQSGVPESTSILLSTMVRS